MSDPASYGLTLNVLGKVKTIPITADQFEEICRAKNFLVGSVRIEEKFDLLLENFAELERTLLDMALEHAVFSGKILVLLDGGRHLVNRRIVNFLTTARLYVDQVAHDLSELYEKGSSQYQTFKDAKAAAYDNVQGYRVMEMLRNYVQHKSLPTHSISFPSSLNQAVEPRTIIYSVVPGLAISELQDDPKLKKKLVHELEAIADDHGIVELMPLVREYAQALGKVHEQVRELTETDVEAADALIEGHIDAAQKKLGQTTGLVAASCDEKGFHIEEQFLNNRPIKRRRDLVEKNSNIVNFAKKHVTSA